MTDVDNSADFILGTGDAEGKAFRSRSYTQLAGHVRGRR